VNRLGTQLALAAAIAVFLTAAAGGQSRSPAPTGRGRPAAADGLVEQFCAAADDPARRRQIVEDAMTEGRSTVEALSAAIESELRPQLARYREAFMGEARKAPPPTAAQRAEAARLRSQILGMANGAGVTKESIIAVGGPAMRRLRAIYFADPGAVLKGSPELQARRQQIAQIGALWEACGAHLFRTASSNKERPKESPSFEKYLRGEEELAVGLAAPFSDQTRSVLAANARAAQEILPEEARAIEALNLTRVLLGLAPMATDVNLSIAARGHSDDMKRLGFFDHISPVPGKKLPWDRAKLLGTKANAENIYRGVTDGRDANQAWFDSPIHLKNMLGDYSRVGIGRAGVYFTEMFGK
jgi:uncharacterized protein YkwD